MKMKTLRLMNEEEKSLLMKKLEEEFEQLLSNGGDIKTFLYIPHTMLTKKIREHLDIILMKEAYISISEKNFNIEKFIVYKDEYLTIQIHEKAQKLELLDRLINYFTEREEYEKCAEILQLKNKLT